jgi:hypothetical protein
VVPGAGKPQALNRYSYVFNNPLKYTDPTGHCGKADDIDAGCTDSACRRSLLDLYKRYGAQIENGMLEGGIDDQWYIDHISEWDGAYGSYYNEHGERFDYQPSTGEHMALGYAQYSQTGDGSILKQFIAQAVAEAPMVYAAAVQTHKAAGGGIRGAPAGMGDSGGETARKRFTQKQRENALAQNKAANSNGHYFCTNCGYENTDSSHFDIDHIVSRKGGGNTTSKNTRVLCVGCNRSAQEGWPPTSGSDWATKHPDWDMR